MLILYLFKTTRKVMKISHHTDSGMDRTSESPGSTERNVGAESVGWLQLALFTVVLTVRSLFFSTTERWLVSFV